MEKQDIEYKKKWDDSFLKVICAFANTKGGAMFIGIENDSKIVGVANAQKLLEVLPNKINDKLGVIPGIELRKRNKKEIIKIITSPSSVPISFEGKYYVRSGSVVLALEGHDLTRFLLHKTGKTWDEIIEEKAKLSEIDSLTISKFKGLAIDRLPLIERERSDKTILHKLNLMRDAKIKRAALLLFGKNTQQYYPQAYLKIGKFISESEVVSSDIVSGNLFQQIESAIDILKTKYLTSDITYEGIHRREKLEYPAEALREAILNALVHRDYSGTSAVQVRVYDDKLVIMNEGKLPAEVPLNELKRKHVSKPRNILLADVFYKAGFIESWGRGTIKIVADCLKQKLPEPQFAEESGVFSVTFFKAIERIGKRVGEKVGIRVGEKVGKRITANQKKIIKLMAQNESISILELSKKIGMAEKNIENNIARLKKNGLIKRIGPARGGRWEVMARGIK